MEQIPQIMEGRIVHTSSGLCDTCESLDFRYIRLLVEDEKDAEGNVTKQSVMPKEHDLGYIDEIVKTNCSLCRLVTKALELSWSKIPIHTISGERIRCFIPASNYTFPNPSASENGSIR